MERIEAFGLSPDQAKAILGQAAAASSAWRTTARALGAREADLAEYVGAIDWVWLTGFQTWWSRPEATA
jgi:hypothetical protein